MRDLKGRFIKGNTEGFKKGHPCYSDNLKEWSKTHSVWNKGKTGYKLSFKNPTERNLKIAEKLKGNKNSLGYHHTEEAKKKIGDSHRGEKSVRWNPDRESLKRNKRNDPEYIQWVKKVKKRDKNSCMLKNQECSGYNIVHHILCWSKYPELRYKTNNGITLCQFHHPRKRSEEQKLIPILKQLVEVTELIC